MNGWINWSRKKLLYFISCHIDSGLLKEDAKKNLLEIFLSRQEVNDHTRKGSKSQKGWYTCAQVDWCSYFWSKSKYPFETWHTPPESKLTNMTDGREITMKATVPVQKTNIQNVIRAKAIENLYQILKCSLCSKSPYIFLIDETCHRPTCYRQVGNFHLCIAQNFLLCNITLECEKAKKYIKNNVNGKSKIRNGAKKNKSEKHFNMMQYHRTYNVIRESQYNTASTSIFPR